MRSEESGPGFGTGFLLGGLVGAALALLLSPRTGEETRDRLMETGIELKDRAGEVAARAREEADDLMVRGRIVLEGQRQRFHEAVDEGKDAASLKKSELLSRYRVAKDTGEAPLMPGEAPPMPGEAPPPPEEGPEPGAPS